MEYVCLNLLVKIKTVKNGSESDISLVKLCCHFKMISQFMSICIISLTLCNVNWHTVLWSIWKTRNDQIFSSKTYSMRELVEPIKSLSWQWHSARKSRSLCLFYEWISFPNVFSDNLSSYEPMWCFDIVLMDRVRLVLVLHLLISGLIKFILCFTY